MEKARQDAVLGIVFFAALALLLWGTLMLTNFSLRERPQLVVQFERLAGLAVGDGVYVLGKRVGEVIDTEYRPEQHPNRMRVVLQFDRDVSLRADASVAIIDANLLGGKRVEIDPGVASGLFPADAVPVGVVKANAIEALGEMMAGDDNKENLRGFLAGLNNVVSKVDTGQGTLGLLVNERELFDSFRTAVDSARNSIQAIERGEGALGRLIHDRQLGEDLQSIGTSLRSIGDKIDRGTGLLATVLNDERVSESFRSIVEDVRTVISDLRGGTGTFGALFRDNELADKVRRIVDDVAEITATAKDPAKGLIGALLGDPELLDDGRAFVAGLREIVDKVNNGEGMLAKLINDEEMGRRLGQILGQVQRAIEDAREAAPVGTFFQVLTGFF